MRLGNLELAVLSKSHRIAMAETARCVLWAHKLRLFPPTTYPYSPLAQRRVLLCEAYRRYPDDSITVRIEHGSGARK